MNILIIEDERSLADVLVELLEQQKYKVDAVYDGVSGEDMAMSGIYDVIVLDIMLPKKSGLEVLRNLRVAKIATPILLLTAKAEVEDRITGLDMGADDYLTKPFATGELLARIRAMTRRTGNYVGDALEIGNTHLNKRNYELSAGMSSVTLSAKEYQILEMLMQNSEQIIPKERFLEKIWGYDSDAEYNAIEVYVSFIRKKLTTIRSNLVIKAVRGVGYSLEVQV